MEWKEQDMQQETPARPRPQRPADAPRRRRPPQNGTQQRRPADGTRRPAASGEAPRRRRPPETGTRSTDGSTQQRRPAGSGQRRPAQSQSGGRRPQNGTRTAPTGTRAAAPDAQRRRRPPVQQDTRPQRTGQAAKKSSTAKNGRRKMSKFRVGMALYICIFFLGTLYGMHILWNYLAEYEKSRPEHTIDAYVTHLPSDFYSQMTQQSLGTAELTPYETTDTIMKSLGNTEQESASYSWGRKGDTYTDFAPDYYIRYGGAAIAHVVLNKEGETDRFGFPVWHAAEPVSLIEVSAEPEYDITVTAPQGAAVSINGTDVPAASMQEGTSGVVLDEAALQITAQPAAESFTLSGLYAAPAVTATDAAGNVLTLAEAPDEKAKHQEYVFLPADTQSPAEELTNRITDLTKAYIKYMINDRSDGKDTWGNLYYLQNYLVNGSSANEMLRSIVYDVSWNNQYISREDKVFEIRHIKMYSDTVCTCQVHFEIQLTKNVVNDYTGTVEWTMVKNDAGVWNASGLKLLQGEDTHGNNSQVPDE